MENESVSKTLLVAVVLCVACSLMVCGTAVLLHPIQEANRRVEMKRNILAAAGLLQEDDRAPDIDALFARIETRLVDLETGRLMDVAVPAEFDPQQAARDPQQSVAIEGPADLAGIRRRSDRALVHLLREGERVERVILPVYGKGLWSTMTGLLALDSDLKTIRCLSFHAHAETPGLGGEIDNPRWKELWIGKVAFNGDWNPEIQVVKGHIAADSPGVEHQVDGISGATITGRSVERLVRFWLGEAGYGPFLRQLRGEDRHG